MSATEGKDILAEVWKRQLSSGAIIGSEGDFLDFLKCTRAKLLATHFTLYDTLSGLQERGIVSVGGTIRFVGTSCQKFSWSYVFTKPGECWQMGETVGSCGTSREEAALRAMIAIWELLTLRRRQARSA